MSIKSLFQILILSFIIVIIGSVYVKFFKNKQNIVQETITSENNNLEQIKKLEKKLYDLEIKNEELNDKILNKNIKNVLIEKKIEVEDKEEIKKKLKTSDNKFKSEKKKLDTKTIKNLG